jgi:hypothetical protein
MTLPQLKCGRQHSRRIFVSIFLGDNKAEKGINTMFVMTKDSIVYALMEGKKILMPTQLLAIICKWTI